MAEITLAPGEKFEHIQEEPSITLHISGTVEFAMSGKSKIMDECESIFVPEGTMHYMKNAGETPCVIRCYRPNQETH